MLKFNEVVVINKPVSLALPKIKGHFSKSKQKLEGEELVELVIRANS